MSNKFNYRETIRTSHSKSSTQVRILARLDGKLVLFIKMKLICRN